jgi:hypothetical protein
MEFKKCKTCGVERVIGDFYIRMYSKNKQCVNNTCKICSNSKRAINRRREIEFIKNLPKESHCEKCNITKPIEQFKLIKSSYKIRTICNGCESNHLKCHCCKELLHIDNFGNNKTNKNRYGKMTVCRNCKSNYDKNYRDKYKEKNKERKKEYYQKVKNEDWFIEKNKKRIRNYKKEYEDIMSDNFKRMKSNLRRLILVYLKKQKNKLDTKPNTESVLGIDFNGFVEHIEKQFLDGMSWDNHGDWHIDHILPCSLSNGDVNVLLKLFNYQNLHPMWAKDNLSKHDSVPGLSCLWDSPFPEFNRK